MQRVEIVWWVAGGDAFFTVCLWRAGYAPTEPGYSVFVPEARVFDPFQWEWNNDNDGEARMLLAVEAFKSGLCDSQCQVQISSCPCSLRSEFQTSSLLLAHAQVHDLKCQHAPARVYHALLSLNCPCGGIPWCFLPFW